MPNDPGIDVTRQPRTTNRLGACVVPTVPRRLLNHEVARRRLTAPDYRFIFQKVVAESEASARKITAAP
jgi:hypothetical protein